MLALLGEISDPDIRALSLGIAAEAEGRAGRSREAAAVFEKAGAAVGSLDAEKRAEALLGLVERARGVRLFDTSLHLLRTAVVESQNAARAERPNILFSVALASARLGETDQAIRFLRDGLEYAELAWSEMDSWPDSILQATLEVGVRLAGSGRLSDVAAIARERNAKSLGSSEARDALVAALICVDHKNELAAISQSLDLPDRLEALVLASEYLSQHGRVAEARQLLFEVADLLSQTAPAQPHDLNRLAAQIGDLSLLARITQGMMPGRYPEGEIRPYDLQSLAQYGHLPAAIKAAWSIRERDDRLETLAALIVEAAQQEKIGRIQADIRRFLADLHSSSDRPPHLRLMDLAVALGEAGQVKAAREVVALVAADAQGRALSKLAVAFARSGHLDEARRLVDGLQDPGLKSETLASVVVEAARRGDSRALLFLPDVEYPSDASRARAAISIWKARDGELRRALEEADGCSSPADQLAAYTAIVVELAVKGDRISSRDALAAPDLSAMRRQLLIAPLARDS
jgi:tetratricopeptide (TPR) repeat protein